MSQYIITLDKISFSYENTLVLQDLSLKVRPGEHIGIIGGSGCGKSTLLKILAGLYARDYEQITIANKHTPEAIRKQVALVMQQHCLFPLSIRDNITCGQDIPEAQIWTACENAGLSEWIKSLPHGLDTNVGERGGQVSGGQAGRIQIARALCKNAAIILLDEPTSELDKDTEHFVLGSLSKLTVGKSVIHITHHSQVLDSSYTIYRLEGGHLIHV